MGRKHHKPEEIVAKSAFQNRPSSALRHMSEQAMEVTRGGYRACVRNGS